MRKNRAGLQKNGMRMMVLDDDVNITPALQAYFEASGYLVDTEHDPVTALQKMRETHYDILLLDFLMEPLCGDEVVTRLRAFDQEIYIILLTGHMELAPPLNTLRQLDIQGYYEKSDRFDQLELLVESCVKSIRQMRIIREYRDGLMKILEASPKLNRLMPLKDIMTLALESAKAVSGASGALIFLRESEQSNGHYLGIGPYDMTREQFEEGVRPLLREAAHRSAETGAVQREQGFLIAPLKAQKDDTAAFGFLVIDALGVKDEDVSRLLGILAQQTSAAILNASLHEDLLRKNEQLLAANDRLNRSYMETIEALRLLVDAKDIYTRGHSDRVAYYAVCLAKAAGLNEREVERVRVSALFHDVGKVGVPDAVLLKNGRLTDEEFAAMRQHPLIGEKIISKLTLFGDVSELVAAHHERIDGRGYPHRLKGEQIPREARMLALADAFDAMTSDRSYRPKMSLEEAIGELKAGRGTQFDAELADLFIHLVSERHQEMQEQLRWTYTDTDGKESAT